MTAIRLTKKKPPGTLGAFPGGRAATTASSSDRIDAVGKVLYGDDRSTEGCRRN